MLLHDLLRQFDSNYPIDGLPNPQVSSVQDDSRKVVRGSLFVARGGTRVDGNRFIADAFARGAVAAVTENPMGACALPQVVVKDAAAAASILAHIHLGRPTRAVRTLAVTGTNGKTTTAYLLREILRSVGRKCGMIGTVEIDDGQTTAESEMTTPGAVELAGLFARMRDNGCQACALEASSHALDQRRCDGVEFAGAAFTNLTGDHIDYHKNQDNYAAAKRRLFELANERTVGVFNADDPWAPYMAQPCRGRKMRFGMRTGVDYQARDIAITAQGSNFVLVTPDGQTPVHMRMIGRHNIANALTAAAMACEVFGLTVHQVAAALKVAVGAPGRLQTVGGGQGFSVLVDYAHTDDALKNVLSALRPITQGKLRVVFGCGGDRDRTKRPRMAIVAQRLADAVYITSDNPRTEDPRTIISEIVAGLKPDLSIPVMVNVDRASAIRQAIGDAEQGDVVLLAGKGHENYQIIGATKHHFDDVEEAAESIRQKSRRSAAVR